MLDEPTQPDLAGCDRARFIGAQHPHPLLHACQQARVRRESLAPHTLMRVTQQAHLATRIGCRVAQLAQCAVTGGARQDLQDGQAIGRELQQQVRPDVDIFGACRGRLPVAQQPAVHARRPRVAEGARSDCSCRAQGVTVAPLENQWRKQPRLQGRSRNVDVRGVERVLAREFPVGRAGRCARLDHASHRRQVRPGAGYCVEHLLDRLPRRLEGREDQAAPLGDVERMQRVRVRVELIEVLAGGNADERARFVVRPAVVRAAQAAVDAEREPGVRVAFDEARAPMTADVAKALQAARLRPQHHRGTPAAVVSHCGAGRRQVRDVADELPARGEDARSLRAVRGRGRGTSWRGVLARSPSVRRWQRPEQRRLPHRESARAGRCRPRSRPSGMRFSTSSADARNWSRPTAGCDTGTATPFAAFTTCSTSAQSTVTAAGLRALRHLVLHFLVEALALGRRFRFRMLLVRRERLHVELAVLHLVEQRLVDDRDLGADRQLGKQRRDVFRIQPDATMARAHADAGGLVGAMHQIARPAEVHRERAERIVGTGRHPRGQDVAFGRVFLAHGSGRGPDRVLALRDDLRRAFGRRPADHADADRHRDHHALLALRGLREIIHPQCREVDDQAFARRIRQHELRGQYDAGALLREPRVDARIGVDDFVVAEIEAARDVRERVFMSRDRRLQRAYDRRGLRVEWERVRRERFRVLRLRRFWRRRWLLRLRREDAAARKRCEYGDERHAARRPDAWNIHGSNHFPPLVSVGRPAAVQSTAGRFGSSSSSRPPGNGG